MEVYGADEADYVPRMRTPLLNRNPPPKTTIAAIIMLIGGIVCISVGLSIMFSNVITHGKDRGVAILVLGGLSKFFVRVTMTTHALTFDSNSIISVYSRKLCISCYLRYMEWVGGL